MTASSKWDEVNIGVATAIDAGLIVPVVGPTPQGLHAGSQSRWQIYEPGAQGRLRLEDLQGGTFTVSNLGMLGIDRFTAIVNPPQAAILAVGPSRYATLRSPTTRSRFVPWR